MSEVLSMDTIGLPYTTFANPSLSITALSGKTGIEYSSTASLFLTLTNFDKAADKTLGDLDLIMG